MKTLKEEFEEFDLMVYQGRMPADMAIEIRNAFYGGATIAIGMMLDGSNKGGGQGFVDAFERLSAELEAFNAMIQGGTK